MNCQNCNHELQGRYCVNCGQPAQTHKINSHFLIHDIQHGLIHFDKGILFTAKELFSRPGNAIKEFIYGKRIQHFKPISLVLVLAGTYAFLFHYFQINILSNNIQVSGSGKGFNRIKEAVSKLGEWITEHYSVQAIVQIPVFALGTFIAFRKAVYNFVEHLVINAFLTSQRLILHIVAFPLFFIFNGSATLRSVVRVTDILAFMLMAWSLFQLFSGLSKFQRAWRIVFSLLIPLTIAFIILISISRYIISTVK